MFVLCNQYRITLQFISSPVTVYKTGNEVLDVRSNAWTYLATEPLSLLSEPVHLD